MDVDKLIVDEYKLLGHDVLQGIEALAHSSAPIEVRLPSELTTEEGKPVSPAEYRRRSKALRRAKGGEGSPC
jgi:hypothetical protein